MKPKEIILSGMACIAMAFAAHGQEKTPPIKNAPEKQVQQPDSVYYVCTMHPDVTAEKPGTCSKCSMPLEKKSIAKALPKNPDMESVKTYTCVTHPDVKSDKPGKCTRCGMDLVIDEKTKY